jgi:quinol monooxygenase YgiN
MADIVFDTDRHRIQSGEAMPYETSQIVELRQYTLHPQRRDALIALFDEKFVESQEAEGMRVMGQFRDLGDPDRFVWLRGFADMASRARGLQGFYRGPVWAAHRDAANATMIDSDDVLLLRPAWNGAGLVHDPARRAGHDADTVPPGLVDVTVFSLKDGAEPALLDFCRAHMTSVLRRGGALAQGWYVTEGGPNNFPRLPVREGENVLVGVAVFEDRSAWQTRQDDWQRVIVPTLTQWLKTEPHSMTLTPTARSAIHA